jgi:Holliday junction resolvase-like predicted endonuclease
MADLLKWAANKLTGLGAGIDRVVPGDQSFLHPTAPVAPTRPQLQLGANVGRDLGMPSGAPQSFTPNPALRRPLPIRRDVNGFDIAAEAGKGIGGDLLHGISRIAPTVLASVAQPGSDALNTMLGVPTAPLTINTNSTALGRAIFGNDPITTYQTQAEQGSQFLKDHGVNNTAANAASIPLAGAMAALDLSALPLAKTAKPALESGAKAVVERNAKAATENAAKQAAVEAKTANLVAKGVSKGQAHMIAEGGQDGFIAPKRPAHQAIIEDALKKGDLPTVEKTIKAMLDDDPYKQSMIDTFKDRIPSLYRGSDLVAPRTKMAVAEMEKVGAETDQLLAKDGVKIDPATGKEIKASIKTSLNEKKLPLAKANGDAYETMTANAMSKQGYKVERTGKNLGRQDGGIDNIARKGNETVLVQDKYRSRDTSIHFGTISQMLGTEAKYKTGAKAGELVRSRLHTTVPVDADAAALAKQHGIELVQTDLKGNTVPLKINPSPKGSKLQLGANDKTAMLNSVPMAQRSHLKQQLADSNSTLSQTLKNTSKENAHQLVRRFYQGFDPQGSFELNQFKAVGAALAKASNAQEVQQVLKGESSTLTEAIKTKIKTDPNFMQKLVDTRTKSGLRDILNSTTAKPVYKVIGGEGDSSVATYRANQAAALDEKLKASGLVKGADGLWKKADGGNTPPPKLPPSAAGVPDPNLPINRGLVDSAHAAPNISAKTKAKVEGTYVPKPNTDLMGEAKALLSDNASIEIKNVKDVDQKVAATMQHALNLDKAGKHNEAAALFNNLAEHGTELGRGVQAFAMLPKMSPQAIAISVAGRINKYNETAIKKIPQLTGDQQKLISDKIKSMDKLKVGSRDHGIAAHELDNLVNSFIPSSLADKAITIWKAGLLTSLRTHERNLIGNAGMSLAEIAKDPVAAVADAAMKLRTGKRTLTPTLNGVQKGFGKESAQQVTDLLKRGFDPSSPISKYDIKQVNWGTGPVQQGLKHYTEAVFRTLGAEDRVGYNSAFARSLHDQAGAAAINAGKKGDSAFIANLVKNPTEDMTKIATTDASYATFHDKTGLSTLASNIKRTAASMPGYKGEAAKVVTEVLMPFTGVPSSIVGKTIAYSPIGLVKGAVNVGRVMAGQVPELQRQAAQEIGRGTVGTGLFGIGAFLMSKGLMTGQPKDAKEATQWQLEGKQANSVLIGGKWRSINSVGPQQLVMLAGAKAEEAASNKDGGLVKYGAALAKDQLSQTFLAGVQGPLQAINDPARYGGTYAQNTAASVVPNIVKDTAKAFDPNQREINSVPDALQNATPFARNHLLPKRDVLGNPMPQEPSGAAAYVDLFNSKTPISNPVVDELSRLSKTDNEATPSKLAKTQTILGNKVKLTPKELDQLEQSSGEPIRQQFSKLIDSKEYQTATDEARQKALNSIVEKARANAKVELGGGTVSSNSDKLGNSAKLTLAKDAFDKSGKSFQVTGNTVFRRDAEGNVTSTPKVKYDYQLGTATLTNQKSSGDVEGWLATANSQLDSITKQLADPAIDPLDAIKLQNDAASLRKEANKYKEYGGFTKPKVGKASKKLSLPKVTTSGGSSSLVKGLKVSARKVAKVSVSKYSAPKLPTLKTTAFKPKTAKIAVKPQKVQVKKVPKFKGYA